MTLQVAGETIPLYVDIAVYRTTKHGNVECVECHVGMNPAPPPHWSASRTYGSWSLFSNADTNVNATRNFYTVPASACLKCHTDARYQAFPTKSDHATDKDRAMLFDNSPRVEIQVLGSDNVFYPVNENYTELDCGACHVNRNCAACHWKSQVVQQQPGSAVDLWTQYDSASTDAKAAMTTKWLDWTTNIAFHRFNGRAELTTSNEVCSSCHSGFYDDAHSGDFPPLGIQGRVIEGHPQVEEVILTGMRGIHTTKPFCTDCHVDIHSSTGIQTASNGWTGGKTRCINCHADKALTGALAVVTCIGCHDAELTPMRDLTTDMVVPETVDVNLEKSWPSHNLIKGADIKCAKCHFSGNNVGADPTDPQGGTVHH